MTNCVNCGAPLEAEIGKCPYCKTSYFDFTNIDFDSHKPCVLQFKINGGIVTQLAIPELGMMTFERGSLSTDITFKAIVNHRDKDETLFTVTLDK